MRNRQMRRAIVALVYNNDPVIYDNRGRVPVGLLRRWGLDCEDPRNLNQVVGSLQRLHEDKIVDVEGILRYPQQPGQGASVVYALMPGPNLPTDEEEIRTNELAEQAARNQAEQADEPAAEKAPAAVGQLQEHTPSDTQEAPAEEAAVAANSNDADTEEGKVAEKPAKPRGWEPRQLVIRNRILLWVAADQGERTEIEAESVSKVLADVINLPDNQLSYLSSTLNMMQNDGEVDRQMGKGGRRTIKVKFLIDLSSAVQERLRQELKEAEARQRPRGSRTPVDPVAAAAGNGNSALADEAAVSDDIDPTAIIRQLMRELDEAEERATRAVRRAQEAESRAERAEAELAAKDQCIAELKAELAVKPAKVLNLTDDELAKLRSRIHT